MIDLPKLKHAVAVARAGSYSLAAREINISQSALTRSVKLLEDIYSIRIFDRSKAGARLTLEGAQFMQIAEEAIRRAQSAHEELALLLMSNTPQVSFGMGPMTAASLLPALMSRFKNDHVRYRIKVESNSTLKLMLRQGDVDFFLGGMRRGAEIHALANQFNVEPIGKPEMTLMVRPGHPLLSDDAPIARLADYPTAAGSSVRETIGFSAVQSAGLQEPSIELDDYSLLIPFILESDHILLGNKVLTAAHQGNALQTLPVKIDFSNLTELAIVSSAQADMSSAMLRTINIIKEVSAQLIQRIEEQEARQDAA